MFKGPESERVIRLTREGLCPEDRGSLLTVAGLAEFQHELYEVEILCTNDESRIKKIRNNSRNRHKFHRIY